MSSILNRPDQYRKRRTARQFWHLTSWEQRSGSDTMTKRIDDLVLLICGAPDHPIGASLRAWCLTSRPVLEFMEAHATKLRKKVRLARSDDERADLLAELSVGTLLAQDRRFQLRYESRPVAGKRAPDFEATFKGHTQVCVEVTRLRLRPEDQNVVVGRLARVLGDKVSQCQSGKMNVLAVVLPAELQSTAVVSAAHRLLLAPEPLTEAGGGRTPAHLLAYRRLQARLSGVLLCSFPLEGAGNERQVMLWENPQAKHPLFPEISRFLTLPSE